MPCDSSHLRASTFEIEMSRVFCLLEEINAGIPKGGWRTNASWRGYHPRVYNQRLNRGWRIAVWDSQWKWNGDNRHLGFGLVLVLVWFWVWFHMEVPCD